MFSTIYEAQVLTGTVVSNPVHLWDRMTVHAMEFSITGSGSVVISVQTSISGYHWIDNGVKANGVNVTSGPDSNGKDNIPLRIKPAEFIRFKLVITGTITLTLSFVQK